MSQSYINKFPDKWLCLYCVEEVSTEDKAIVDRDDIPTHLVYKHGWESECITWEYIYNRLSYVGGV